jgi:hypothetical protein
MGGGVGHGVRAGPNPVAEQGQHQRGDGGRVFFQMLRAEVGAGLRDPQGGIAFGTAGFAVVLRDPCQIIVGGAAGDERGWRADGGHKREAGGEPNGGKRLHERMIRPQKRGDLRGGGGEDDAGGKMVGIADPQTPAIAAARDRGDLCVLVDGQASGHRLCQCGHAGGADRVAAAGSIRPGRGSPGGGKFSQQRGKARRVGIHILCAMVKLQALGPAGGEAATDAAPLVKDDGGMSRLRQMLRASQTGHAGPDDGDGDHAGTIWFRIWGICCLTLKKPAVAWGQMARSQSRCHSVRVMPRAAR